MLKNKPELFRCLFYALALTLSFGCQTQRTGGNGSVPSAIKLCVAKTASGISLVYLPGGKFLMGQKEIPLSDPVHPVVLSPFWMGRYEVTNAQFEQFKKRPRSVESPGDKQPVTRITYDQADAFCKWLSKKEKAQYRLPTEAEWEYAARGGLVQKLYPWGADRDWNGKAAFGMTETKPVGSYAPNSFGLYDMSGNVSEWVSDWYDESYYKASPLRDPKGPATFPPAYGPTHLSRGGAFGDLQGECGLRNINPLGPELIPDVAKFGDPMQSDGSGFRIVREIKTGK